MSDYYRIHNRPPGKRKSRIIGVIVFIIFVILLVVGFIIVRNWLKPQATVTSAKAVTKKVNFDTKVKSYDEGDFTIEMPTTWAPIPRPPGPYKSFTWQTSSKGTDGQEIVVYEDTIPVNYAVNRMQVVAAAGAQLTLIDSISDNCSKYTKNTVNAPNQVGVPAKWQGVDFMCDQSNQQRDVIGTSSTDGINTVIMVSPTTGASHKFFFTYTDHNISPDYTVFAQALQSFRLK